MDIVDCVSSEGQSGLAEAAGDDPYGKLRQIHAKGGNWVYEAGRLWESKKEIPGVESTHAGDSAQNRCSVGARRAEYYQPHVGAGIRN